MPSSSSGSGKLTQVASVRNQLEAEMIRGLLSEHGIPSMAQQPGGGTPYGLFFPHQILVPAEIAERAREVLEGMPGTD